MKTLKSILYLGAAVMLTAGFASCSDDDESYDFPGDPYNRVYVKDYSAQFKIVQTPISTISNVGLEIPAQCSQKAQGDINVKFAVDNSLIDTYNTENGTQFSAVPEAALAFENMTVTIPAGDFQSSENLIVKLTEDETILSSLNADYGYLMPIVVESISGGSAQASTNMMNTTYVVMTVTNDNVNHGASEEDITGTLVADQSGWSATGNAGPDWYGNDPDYSVMFDGDVTNYGSFSNDEEDMWIAVDMGKPYTFDGIKIYYAYGWGSYVYEYGSLSEGISFSVSDDGTNWRGIGQVESGDNDKIVAFYAPVTARYLRVDVPNKGGWYGASLYAGMFNIFAK